MTRGLRPRRQEATPPPPPPPLPQLPLFIFTVVALCRYRSRDGPGGGGKGGKTEAERRREGTRCGAAEHLGSCSSVPPPRLRFTAGRDGEGERRRSAGGTA
ncbi:hypothetical protein DV515_00013485 [Chloebia gouldiae]|uniref:Uncharacterized protein n=1 Tax=Chloebia gouldiae TaxID=44316 RepID=A0A3L8S0V6_CHLGU|nr:hypothetical protein DV515_00013485 [Chloebia gouldiae]